MDFDRLETVLSACLRHFVTTQEPDAGGSLVILRVDVRMLSNRNSYPLLVRKRNGRATLENSPTVSDKTKHTLTV